MTAEEGLRKELAQQALGVKTFSTSLSRRGGGSVGSNTVDPARQTYSFSDRSQVPGPAQGVVIVVVLLLHRRRGRFVVRGGGRGRGSVVPVV